MVSLRTTFLLAAVVVSSVGVSQPRAVAQLPSVVQLPSFQTFSYTGSVMVPDGGTASLGGVRRSSSSFSRRGLSRGAGFAHSFPQASVSATIIDNAEIDRQILGASPEEFVRQNQQRESQLKSRPKVLTRTEEGKSLVRYARKQYQQGNESMSFDAYLMAINVLDGRLKELATVEFRRVFGTAADQSLRLASMRR
ncbi:MAG: hypothetical protein ACR2NZ_24005 [Rubripirellula sp.]